MTRRKVCLSPAPRSFEALLERAIEAGHARAHYDRDEREAEGHVPITIGPRLSGQGRPIGQPVRAKNASSATPMQISGITIGRAIAPSNAGLPGKRKRHSASASSAPITVLIAVAMSAITMLLVNASIRTRCARPWRSTRG